MEPLERKAELVRRGKKLIDIARKRGVSANRVTAVLYGDSPDPQIQQDIADLLEKPRHEVFPPRKPAA